MIPESLANQIKALPKGCGVYIFKDSVSNPVYVGKAKCIVKRAQSHFRDYNKSYLKEGLMLAQVASIEALQTEDEANALLLEASLIKQYQPKFNVELKDDKSYPFLHITAERYPRLLQVRGRKAGGGIYFGPYTSAHLLTQAVKMLRTRFPLRTCNQLPKKLCLLYDLKLCGGPCEEKISRVEYMKIVKRLEAFLEGNPGALVANLVKSMEEHSKKRDYEKAKTVYERIKALESIALPKKNILPVTTPLDMLRSVLELPELPWRIEGFDISNLSGKEAVGSMAVMLNGKLAKGEYRHYKIKKVHAMDDYAMMREVISRRYERLLSEKKSLPQLVMIDGGVGHLEAAHQVLRNLGIGDLKIISIAKQHEHIYQPGTSKPVVLPQNSPALQLAQQLRDEAHRFAIMYYRKLHRKKISSSILDAIDGVGPKTRQRLLTRCGSVAKIKAMTVEELVERAGVNKMLAAKIIKHLA